MNNIYLQYGELHQTSPANSSSSSSSSSSNSSSSASELSSFFEFFSELGWHIPSWWPGVVLVLVGAISMNVGMNVMKLAINQTLEIPQAQRSTKKSPLWLTGCLVFIVGTVLNFAAFKFAAQSLLTGLSSVQFISQVLFSKLILKEHVDNMSYLGVAFIIGGCACIVTFGKHDTKNYSVDGLMALYGRSSYVCYLLTVGCLSCIAWLGYAKIKQIVRNRDIRGLRFHIMNSSENEKYGLAAFFAIRSGIAGSQTVLQAKSLSMLLTQIIHPKEGYPNPLTRPPTYFIILATIFAATYWVIRLNKAIKTFEAVYMIPMMQISWIIFATISGGLYYEEFVDLGYLEITFFVVGFNMLLIGVALLCPRKDGGIQVQFSSEFVYHIVSDENKPQDELQDNNSNQIGLDDAFNEVEPAST